MIFCGGVPSGGLVDVGCWAGFWFGFFVIVGLVGTLITASLLVAWGCEIVFLPSLYFWATLWVSLFVFSVGHEWSMLHLEGSGVLSQGVGFGVFGVCSLFP